MQNISLSKKAIKRIVAISSIAAATAAVGIFAVVSTVGTQAAGKMLPIYRVDRGDNKVALTFDVAWENSNTDELIEILEEYDAEATFFITGDWCDRYPDDVRKFHDAGHEVQNHSDQHPHVEGINVNDLIEDTNEAARKIEMLTGEAPTLYRAPYGEYDDSMMMTLEGIGYKVIQWDVDSIDWQEPTPDEIVKRITDKAESGSILLFHNDLENTTEALPQILEQLSADGYEFVTVSDLIYYENYTINAEGEQIPDVLSGLGIDTDNVDEVMAEYSDEIVAAGFSEKEISEVANAIKNGEGIPDEVLAVIADIGAELADDMRVVNGDVGVNTEEDAAAEIENADGGLVEDTETHIKTEPQN